MRLLSPEWKKGWKALEAAEKPHAPQLVHDRFPHPWARRNKTYTGCLMLHVARNPPHPFWIMVARGGQRHCLGLYNGLNSSVCIKDISDWKRPEVALEHPIEHEI